MYVKLNLQLIQPKYLQRLMDNNQWVMVYLSNGTKLEGQLVGYTDNFLFLKNSLKKVIERNAIHKVLPAISYQENS
jgi:sRNA-binding regulator protein Hfq